MESEPSPEAVRQQLKRMLDSRAFARARLLSKFLRYGVEAALNGRVALSEAVVARDVFDRGDDFDTKLDPIVRVQARRLRSKLAQYYACEGAGDLVEIELPLRQYVPRFRVASFPVKAITDSPPLNSPPLYRKAGSPL